MGVFFPGTKIDLVFVFDAPYNGGGRRVNIMQDAIHNCIMQELTETVPQHPGVHVPKKDKILEWTLYGILEQLKGISKTLNEVAAELRTSPR